MSEGSRGGGKGVELYLPPSPKKHATGYKNDGWAARGTVIHGIL